MDGIRSMLLDAILPHAAIAGWQKESFEAAVMDAGTDPVLARAACPRGAVDLAVELSRRSDDLMEEQVGELVTSRLPYSEKVAEAVCARFVIMEEHREANRRAMARFVLPEYLAEGGRLIWETSDRIWSALGDRSEDYNWYTKRAMLSAVLASTRLYWLRDTSEDLSETRAFVYRRIHDVMQIERAKGRIASNRLIGSLYECVGSFCRYPGPLAGIEPRQKTQESRPNQ